MYFESFIRTQAEDEAARLAADYEVTIWVVRINLGPAAVPGAWEHKYGCLCSAELPAALTVFDATVVMGIRGDGTLVDLRGLEGADARPDSTYYTHDAVKGSKS